jgi:hypothetical protein
MTLEAPRFGHPPKKKYTGPRTLGTEHGEPLPGCGGLCPPHPPARRGTVLIPPWQDGRVSNRALTGQTPLEPREPSGGLVQTLMCRDAPLKFLGRGHHHALKDAWETPCNGGWMALGLGGS